MGELLAGLFRVVMEALAYFPPIGFVQKRRRKRRLAQLAQLAQGKDVRIPVDLKDPELTGSTWQNGHLLLGGRTTFWQPRKGRTNAVPFTAPALEMASADSATVAFRSPSGRTELRVHADEAPAVLRALDPDGT
ncbi:hypothetical protein ACFWZ2_05735 [Streptomyces sp. NPDC059002]|uniref:hypothetical protein n=1 Tax=Streptomyces sp. NPDC059002 TaxID=3346690 RepID=UPI00369710E3